MISRLDPNWPLQFRLIGPLQVTRPDGTEVTPRGRKACAILAMLALSPKLCRSRTVLQDRLWSDRAPEQGSASLRQALSEIRRALGPSRDCLIADLRTVALASELVEIDLEMTDLEALARSSANDPPVLLEGLDIRDPEFEHWLRDQRTAFQNRLELQITPNKIDDEKVHELFFDSSTAIANPLSRTKAGVDVLGMSIVRPWIRLLPPRFGAGDSAAFLSRLVAVSIASDLGQSGEVDVVEVALDRGTGLALEVEAVPTSAGFQVQVSVKSDPAGPLFWAGSRSLMSDKGLVLDSPELHLLINQTSEICRHYLHKLASQKGDQTPFLVVQEAVKSMFAAAPAELNRAEKLLGPLTEQSQSGIAMAWLAFSQTFRLGEMRDVDLLPVRDRARELARKALEQDPTNATVLALCSYVFGFVLQEYHASHEFAKRSLELNPRHSLALAALARAKCYLGSYDEGYRLAVRARAVSGPSPLNCTIDFIAAVSALLTRRFKESAALAEGIIAKAPTYRAAYRYLAPLYLHLGNRQGAQSIIEKLTQLEPGFSLENFRSDPIRGQALRASAIPHYQDSDL